MRCSTGLDVENTQGREREAVAPYRKLARRVPDPRLRLSCAAKALMLEGRLDEATEQFRRLVALRRTTPARASDSRAC